MKHNIKEQRLIGLGIFFALLFNFPILQAINRSAINGNLQLLLFFFMAWLSLIAILYFILKRKNAS